MRKKERKSGGAFLLGLVVLFLISFSTSSWIYIKSNNLVFADDIKNYEEKAKTVDENIEKIEELEAQVERYKSLYDSAVRENKELAATVSKVQEAQKEAEKKAEDKEETDKTDTSKDKTNKEATNKETTKKSAQTSKSTND